jgi:hypothetical protein
MIKCQCTECQDQEERIAAVKNYGVKSLQEEMEKKLPPPTQLYVRSASEFTRGYNAGYTQASIDLKIAFEELKRMK